MLGEINNLSSGAAGGTLQLASTGGSIFNAPGAQIYSVGDSYVFGPRQAAGTIDWHEVATSLQQMCVRVKIARRNTATKSKSANLKWQYPSIDLAQNVGANRKKTLASAVPTGAA